MCYRIAYILNAEKAHKKAIVLMLKKLFSKKVKICKEFAKINLIYFSHSQGNNTSTTKGEITMKNTLKSIRNGIFANYLPTDPVELIAFSARNLILFIGTIFVVRLIF